jgi:hypothetical protein
VARNRALREIKLLGGRNVVISSNLPVRGDGLPYANGRAEDPAIAVYWQQPGEGGSMERVMACDVWRKIEDNLHAIVLSIGALRDLERWGSSSIVDRAFAGFSALPSVASIDWRCELMIDGFPPRTLEDARRAYREKARFHHPDVGGSVEAMTRLNEAWEAAQKELA